MTPTLFHCTSHRERPSNHRKREKNRSGTGLVERNQFHREPEHSRSKRSRINGSTVQGVCPLGTPLRPMLFTESHRCIVFASNHRLRHRFRQSKYRIVKKESLQSVLLTRLAAALLLLAVLRGEVDNGLAGARLVLSRLAGVKSLAGDNAVDF